MNQTISFTQKGLIINKKGSSLLVSKYLSSKYVPQKLNNKFCLPGGQLEFGQQPDESFIGEVQSETGITISPGSPFYIWTWIYETDSDKQKQIIAVARNAFYKSGEIAPPSQESETTLDNARWMDFEEIKKHLSEFVIDEQPAIKKFLDYHSCHSGVNPEFLKND